MKVSYMYQVLVAVKKFPEGGQIAVYPLFYAHNVEDAIDKAKKYYAGIGAEVEITGVNQQGHQPVVF